MPWQRKIPKRFVEDGGGREYDEVQNINVCYRRIYYQALDAVIGPFNNRFDQPGYRNYENIEQLLLNAANGSCLTPWIDNVIATYHDDIDRYKLRIQLQQFSTALKDVEDKSIREIIAFMKSMPPAKQSFFSEVFILLRILMLAPATNADHNETKKAESLNVANYSQGNDR